MSVTAPARPSWPAVGGESLPAGDVARRRGGNRLVPAHPAWGNAPSYQRQRAFMAEVDPERRDRNQRNRFRWAVGRALERGLLCSNHARVLLILLDQTDDRVENTWWKLATIARLVQGDGHYGDDNPEAGQRSANRWMRELRELGWIDRIHRNRIADGAVTGTSNLWRFTIPEGLRAEAEQIETAARQASSKRAKTAAKTGPTNKAPQNRRPDPDKTARAARATADRNELRRSFPCPACDTSGFIDAPDSTGVVGCPACDQEGHLAPRGHAPP